MSRSKTSDRSAERGFTLAGLIVIMTVLMVFVAYTVPRQWSKVMARERDRQAIFVMKQYARSILEFQKKHAGLPTSLDQLKDARKPRFVRGPKGEWIDPLTGEVDWILIPPSQQGQPINNQVIGGNRNDDKNPSSDTNKDEKEKDAKQKNAGDYVGPFVGVRPNKTGKSFIALNSAENYEDWSYTITDLTAEMNGHAASLTAK